jgi:hypothetical protein
MRFNVYPARVVSAPLNDLSAEGTLVSPVRVVPVCELHLRPSLRRGGNAPRSGECPSGDIPAHWPSRPLSATSALRPRLDHQDDRQGDEDANDDPNRAAKDGTGSEPDQGGDEVFPVTRHPFTSSGLRGTFLNAGPPEEGRLRRCCVRRLACFRPQRVQNDHRAQDHRQCEEAQRHGTRNS